MNNTGPLLPGTTVRIKSDPGRQGVLTGKHRCLAGVLKYQVAFPDIKTFLPDYELEVVSDDNSDWITMIQEKRYGRVRDLRRNLTHIHLSGRLANIVYSMDATNTDFYAYQYKPVLSFLDSPSKGLLIADEVGLGKTIEAGLIWTELRARYDARRLIVVCPAMLREKWCSELNYRFGVDARIMGTAEILQHLEQDKHNLPDGQGIVCSIQGLRPPKGWRNERRKDSTDAKLARFLEEKSTEEPLIDLVIIDEAHYLRNPETQNAQLGQLLRGVTENILLLSATPINLSNDDLFHLLNLVDPDSFRDKEVFPQVLGANEHLQKARDLVLDVHANAGDLQEELSLARSHPLLSGSQQLAELATMDLSSSHLDSKFGRIQLAKRIEKINLLHHAITRTRKSEVTEWRVIREPVKHFVELEEEGPEWRFYRDVTETIRRYAWEVDISDGFLLAGPQRQVSSCMYAAAKAWQERYEALEEQEEQLYEDFGRETGYGIENAPLIERLRKEVLPNIDVEALRRHDSKYEKFRNALLDYLRRSPSEKVIVFSFYRKTLSYLQERLEEEGVKARVLVGGMRETKQEIIGEFRENSETRVLLSSEVASEGVDLQFCRVLFNYDLPWNPMKIEQRIGRIDRIGQEAEKIKIVNLLYANTIDHRIHERLYERLRIFERALGGMEAILGEKISDLTADLLKKPLTPEQEQARIEQTAMAIERIRQDQDELEKQASHLIAHGGYILDEVQAAYQFKKRITEDDLVAYVKDYLDRFCQGFDFHQLKHDELIFDLRLPASTSAALDEFVRRNRLSGQTRLATGGVVKCKFANKVRNPKSRNEIISQFHPLIRFISQKLRGEDFYSLVSIKLNSSDTKELASGIYAFFVHRWFFRGIRTEEELPVRVIHLESDSLLGRDKSWEILNLARLRGIDWFEAPNAIDAESLVDALGRCSNALDSDYELERTQRENENRDRVAFQVESAKRHKDRQLESRRKMLNNYQLSGNQRMIPAIKGQIKKIEERFDIQEEKLKLKAKFRPGHSEVCCGAILVE